MSPVTFRRKTIPSDKTLGELFLAAREELEVSLAEAERSTRIRQKYLAALEASHFEQLPEEVYTLGFVRRYAAFLRLDPNAAVRRFRAERLAKEKLGLPTASLTPTPALSRLGPISEPRLVITPKIFWLTTSLAAIVAVSGYLWYQVQGFMSAPALELASAATELSVTTPTIAIEGQTTETARLTINAEPVTIGTDGRFRQEIHLEPGLNTIEVTATNKLNRETTKQLRVVATYPPTQGAVPAADPQS